MASGHFQVFSGKKRQQKLERTVQQNEAEMTAELIQLTALTQSNIIVELSRYLDAKCQELRSILKNLEESSAVGVFFQPAGERSRRRGF